MLAITQPHTHTNTNRARLGDSLRVCGAGRILLNIVADRTRTHTQTADSTLFMRACERAAVIVVGGGGRTNGVM